MSKDVSDVSEESETDWLLFLSLNDPSVRWRFMGGLREFFCFIDFLLFEFLFRFLAMESWGLSLFRSSVLLTCGR
jgi:hypothetical protein